MCSICNVVVADALVLPGSERPMSADERYAVEADDSQLLPQLFFGNRDALGRPVGQRLVWALRRNAQRYNLRPGERGMLSMESRIRRLGAQHALPQTVVLRAIYLYRRVKRMRLFQKPGLDDWSLALLYTACRESRYVITLEDLVRITPLARGKSPKERQGIQRRSIRKVLDYHRDVCIALDIPSRQFSVENYVTYFSGKVGINGEISTAAVRLARPYVDSNPNSSPESVAAAALYLSIRRHGYDISQKDYCGKVNLSEISLRRWVQNLGETSERLKRTMPEVDTDSVGDWD